MKEKFTIEDLLILDAGAEGVCIGKYEERVVFVNNVVPGDVVDVEVYKKKHHYYMARLLQLRFLLKKEWSQSVSILVFVEAASGKIWTIKPNSSINKNKCRIILNALENFLFLR